MKRNLSIDLVKVMCMTWVIVILHFSAYLGDKYNLWKYPFGFSLTYASLGTFSFIAGFLIGCRYEFNTFADVLLFYKKRIIRFYPLFILSTILLWSVHFLKHTKAAIFSLFGLAPFISPRPLTLWYISMIIIFYLLTPLVLNKRKWLISALIVLSFAIYSQFFILDIRFLFNICLYLFGLCIASEKDSVLSFIDNKKTFTVSVLLYISFLLSLHYIGNINCKIWMSNLGVIAILSTAFMLEKKIRNKSIISFLSYISMSFYLFHRFTYKIFLKLWYPDNAFVTALYLLLVAVPIGGLFAYWIQKEYDRFSTRFFK